MEKLQIEFRPNLKSKILDLLSTFSNDEVKVVDNNSTFILEKNKLQLVSKKIKDGTINYCNIDELDKSLEKVIAEYEN